jgi:aldehyde:ferredoxin oxidoreductase
MTEGANRKRKVDVDKMIEDYWRYFGWNTNTGKPNDEAMKFD